MFGLSWGQNIIIVLVGVFVLGPERIPTAVRWVTDGLRKLRTMAAGAQAQLNREIGPELDELRRQIADLQSLKELQELRELRDLHPKRLIGNTILGEEFAGGGIGGFLGLKGAPSNSGAPTGAAAGISDGTAGDTPGVTGARRPVTPEPPGVQAAPSAPVPAPSPARVPAPMQVTKLAAPKVVGAPRRPTRAPDATPDPAGFDIDAT